MFMLKVDDNRKIGTVILGISGCLYLLGILFLLDRALLMLANLLFLIGFYLIVGLKDSIMFFTRRIKGTIAFCIGFLLIIFKLKIIGVALQLYGIYQFFKEYALRLLQYFEFIPVIGPYIKQLSNKNNSKKNDDINKV